MKEKDKNKKTLAIITDSPLLQTSYSTVGQQIVEYQFLIGYISNNTHPLEWQQPIHSINSL